MLYNAVKLSPAFKDYLWGGNKLKTDFNKKTDLEIVAESWELSTHKDGKSIIAEGKYKGYDLESFINLDRKNILGKNAEKFEYFPILIKFIDAKDNLSIQVHPDDAYALKNEGEYGKTEVWYILDCEEDAFLYYGFNKKITKEEFEKRIKDNTLLEVLNKVNVKKGDVFFIKSGTVHAIGKGIVICEVQQNSNTTYRVYDYDRRDKNGNARELHIDKAIEVSTLDLPENYGNSKVCKCEYFTVQKEYVKDSYTFKITDKSFASVIVTEGSGELKLNNQKLSLQKGDSVFIPAQNIDCTIEGDLEVIISYV